MKIGDVVELSKRGRELHSSLGRSRGVIVDYLSDHPGGVGVFIRWESRYLGDTTAPEDDDLFFKYELVVISTLDQVAEAAR
jgi:hypothetical protein